jgi:hypothetical protein
MRRVEQTSLTSEDIRPLAASFDIPAIRDRLFNLAAKAVELAKTVEKAIGEGQSAPINKLSGLQ